jgi:hypothetical protein
VGVDRRRTYWQRGRAEESDDTENNVVIGVSLDYVFKQCWRTLIADDKSWLLQLAACIASGLWHPVTVKYNCDCTSDGRTITPFKLSPAGHQSRTTA